MIGRYKYFRIIFVPSRIENKQVTREEIAGERKRKIEGSRESYKDERVVKMV